MRHKHERKALALCAVVCVVVFAALGSVGRAAAKLTGEFARFDQCAYADPEVNRCVYSTTTGGEIVIGSRRVPIVNPVVLRGAYGEIDQDGFAKKFYPAKDGITFSKAPQPVPGGLAGIVPPGASPPLVKTVLALFFENGLSSVSSTLELAKPASAIRISENHLAEGTGVALELPLKAHLENPFLGESCYIGSSSSPLTWKLTTGTMAPPGPNKPVRGKTGTLSLLEGGSVLGLDRALLVDNSWSAPAASGCGGFLSFLVDPIVNDYSGLPSAAGRNTAILESTVYESPAEAVRDSDK